MKTNHIKKETLVEYLIRTLSGESLKTFRDKKELQKISERIVSDMEDLRMRECEL